MIYRVRTMIEGEWHMTIGRHSKPDSAIEICNSIGDHGLHCQVVIESDGRILSIEGSESDHVCFERIQLTP